MGGAALPVEGARTAAGVGENARVLDEFEVDTGLLKELREHERQLREELNDFSPNLRAVGRSRDLLEMAGGKTRDGSNTRATVRFNRTLEELLVEALPAG